MPDSFLILQSGFLGDAVLASGMLRTIQSARPEVRVGLVVREEFAGLFVNHPAISTLHPFDKTSKGGTERLIESLRSVNYDLALLPHRSYRTAWIARRAGIPERIGFRQSDAPWLLTSRAEYRIAQHETERNAMLLRQAGVDAEEGRRLPWLLPDEMARERMRLRFGGSEGVVVVAPGSVWPTKRWTTNGYADVIRWLAERGTTVVLVGSPGERELCDAIAAQAGAGCSDVAAGELSLVELLALISLADRVITNDSAPLHLAESVGTPVTAIFGPTVPEFGFGPRRNGSAVVGIDGLACRPCRIHGSRRCPIGTHECMRGISSDDVLRMGRE